MLQLSLSWLGLGSLVASPWLLLLLVGASWLLACVLARIYAFCDNCCRLRCFLQPPKRNWFWGPLGLVKSNEEGMRLVEDLGHYFRDVHLWWMGPFYPILRLIHPNFTAPCSRPQAKWQCLASEGSTCLDMFEHISLMTLDSLQKCVFSFNSNLPGIFLHMDLLYYLTRDGQHFHRACDLVHDFTEAVIRERHCTLISQCSQDFLKAKAKAETLDFIDVLLLAKDEDGKELSDEDIRAEADTFMFEGHDTTASGLSWVLYNLVKYPEYQERCQQEVRELLRDREPKEIEW
eukprot:bmy_19203T0